MSFLEWVGTVTLALLCVIAFLWLIGVVELGVDAIRVEGDDK